MSVAYMMIFILPIDFLSVWEIRGMKWGLNFNMECYWYMIFVFIVVLYMTNKYAISYYNQQFYDNVFHRSF